jgi:hypothetical protein
MQALSRARKAVGYLATDRWLVVSALLLVSATRFALCILPVRRAARLLGWLVPGRPGKPPDPSLADRVAAAIMHASRVVPGAACLTQALAAQVLLERHGVPTRLHIGIVRDGQQAVRGHAWVETQGMIVIGGIMAGQWRPLLTVEGARTWSSPPGRPS